MNRTKANEIVNSIKRIVGKYEKHQEVFEHFNFKVYDFFHEIYGNKKALKTLGLEDYDNIYNYLDNRYRDFEDGYREEIDGVEIEQYNRTSSRFLKGYVLEGTEFIGDYGLANTAWTLGKSKGENIFLDLKSILKLIEDKKFLKVLKTVSSEYDYFSIEDNLLSEIKTDLKDIEYDMEKFIKAYYFIEHSKNTVTLEDYLYNELFSLDLTDLIENKKIKYITDAMLDNMIWNNSYKIIKAKHGHKAKIYTSYAKQPLIVDIVSEKQLLNLI